MKRKSIKKRMVVPDASDSTTTHRRAATMRGAGAESVSMALAWTALFFAALLAYWPALHGSFLWDDEAHVTRTGLRSLHGLAEIWFHPGATQQYYPLLHSAFWFEHKLWGDSAVVYHLLNVLLHATSAFLFGHVLLRLKVPGAWLAAGIFALHPVCVESIAWISEQKNALSGVFYLAAALAYLRFDEERKPKIYALATLCFIAAILSKSVTATLPAALWVVLWMRRGRLETKRDVLPLAPWLVAGMAMGLLTAWAERKFIGAHGAAWDMGVMQRVLLAGRVPWFYLGKLILPIDLMFMYPRWKINAGAAWQYLYPVAALGALVILWLLRKRSRAPLAAALIFGGTLFPALGFFNVFPFQYSYVADHFQYLAMLAPIPLAAAGITLAMRDWEPARSRAVGLTLLAILFVVTRAQAGIYTDLFTLYSATLKKNPDSWFAANNLGAEYLAQGNLEMARPLFDQSIALKPDYAEAHANLGNLLTQQKQFNAAIEELKKSLAIEPGNVPAENNLGLALDAQGKTAEALEHFDAALRAIPGEQHAALNAAKCLVKLGRFDEARRRCEAALPLHPENYDLQFYAAQVYVLCGDAARAIAGAQAALNLQPQSAEARDLLNQLLAAATQ